VESMWIHVDSAKLCRIHRKGSGIFEDPAADFFVIRKYIRK